MEVNKGLQIASNPIVARLAASGEPWAKKLLSKGWSSLNTNQKKRAEAAVGFSRNATVIVPRRNRVTNPVPKGQREGPGQAGRSMTTTGEELLHSVVGHTGQIPQFKSWVVSPRNVSVFQKMSLMAMNFNKYKVTKLDIMYSPACSFETNGRVTIAFNDDASDSDPITKVGLYNLKSHTSTNAQVATILSIPVDGKIRFCRDAASDDAKLVDFGRIILSTYGFDDDTTVVGELFVRYTIVLSDPTKVAKVSQVYNNGTMVGPEYAVASHTPTLFTLRLLTGGSWYVVFKADLDGSISKPTLVGEGITGEIFYSAGNVPVAFCAITTQLEDQEIQIVTTEAGTGISYWGVFRS